MVSILRLEQVKGVFKRLAPLVLAAASIVAPHATILAVAAIVLTTTLCYNVRLVRGESPEEQARAYRVAAGVIIAGIIMAVAKPIAQWLTGINFDNPTGNLPPELVTMANKLFSLLMYVGTVVIVAGFIYVGIQLARQRGK